MPSTQEARVFDTVIAGIDGTRASFDAGRQASRLTRPDGSLLLLAAADPHLTLMNRWGPRTLVGPAEPQGVGDPPLAVERLTQYAGDSLSEMRAQIDSPSKITERVVDGTGLDALRSAAETEGAQLVAVGDHGYRRFVGIARESTTTELLHEAPCSVLVARRAFDPVHFPGSIVVGVDGSKESFAALELAATMATRGVTCRVVVAESDNAPLDEIEHRAGSLAVDISKRRAVKALTEAAAEVDLLILGARGLSGAAALGSVSERVAHGAASSVLVVR